MRTEHSERKRLIVNADDFGLTEGVNRAVIDGHRHGIITSATLMANGRAFESAVEMAASESRLGVGVHLNLIEGAPTAHSASIPSLVDGSGRLFRSAGSIAARVSAGAIRIGDVERELRAQIERVLATGIRPTHLDGHKHVHLAPRVFDVVIRLAVEYRIPGVRCAVEAGSGIFATAAAAGAPAATIARQRASGRALSLLAATGRRRLATSGLRSPKRILGITETGYLCGASLERLFRARGAWPAELMCHPGYVDDALLSEPTRLTASRERELDALTAATTRAVLDREEIELINYGDLAEAI